MKCNSCFGDTKIIDTVSDSECVYRRRKCLDCGKLMYTQEMEADNEQDEKYIRNKISRKSKGRIK